MVVPMDIDESGVSGQVTPADSYTESSVKRDDTPESTEVTPLPPPNFQFRIMV